MEALSGCMVPDRRTARKSCSTASQASLKIGSRPGSLAMVGMNASTAITSMWPDPNRRQATARPPPAAVISQK